MVTQKAESKGTSPLSAGDVTNDLSHVRKIIVACTPVWVLAVICRRAA